MRKRRHRLQLEDFQNIVTHCEGCEGGTLNDLLRSCEVARLLHVSPMTIYYWVNKKNPEIPYIRIGDRRGVVRFPRAWLLQWAALRMEELKKWNFEL
jgi:excisionase family DNA binding protein